MSRRSALALLALVLCLPLPAAAADTPVRPATLSAPATVTPAAVHARLARKDSAPLVLDVRTPEEYAAGHVPGAVNLPHDQVAARLGELPKDREIVMYCRSGRRVGLAAEVLAAAGFGRLSHLQGDMPGWEQAGLPIEK